MTDVPVLEGNYLRPAIRGGWNNITQGWDAARVAEPLPPYVAKKGKIKRMNILDRIARFFKATKGTCTACFGRGFHALAHGVHPCGACDGTGYVEVCCSAS